MKISELDSLKRKYAHLWQTSAPRFDIRACHCVDCVARYPHHKTLP